MDDLPDRRGPIRRMCGLFTSGVVCCAKVAMLSHKPPRARVTKVFKVATVVGQEEKK